MGVLDELRAQRRAAGTASASAADGQQPALLLIPDISGFTRFIEQSGSPQAPFLVADLLEILIEANILELEVNEIQGDAVLFYRLGPPPSVARPGPAVPPHLPRFSELPAPGGARSRARNWPPPCSELALTLKIVVHYGRVSVARIREHTKLMGRDVIVVHRLLKNNVAGAEYVLLSEGYTRTQAARPPWPPPSPGRASARLHLLRVPRRDALPVRLPLAPAPAAQRGSLGADAAGAPGRGCLLKVRRALPVPAAYALRMVSNFRLRPRWMEGATAVHYDVTKAGRLGTSYKVDVLNGQIDFQTVQCLDDEDGRITYVEKISHFRLFPNALLFYHLEAVDIDSCFLTLELRYGHVASDLRLVRFGQLRRLHRFLGRSLIRLSELVNR